MKQNSCPVVQANIERLMLKQKIRMLPLAKKAGISKGLLWKLMTDPKSNPTLHTLDTIASALGEPSLELFR
jgi:transcriptional regulator with XRE-family HTH domain